MKKAVDFILFLLFQLIRGFFFLFPRRFCLFLGRMLGFSFFLFDSRHRKIALVNLSDVLGSTYSQQALAAIARSSFLYFGEMILDLIKFSTLKEKSKSRLITIEGTEHIQKALEEKKGILLFTGHFGNWEIAPFCVSRWGTLKVIARPLDNAFMEKELYRLRTALGGEVIHKQKAARDVLRALQKNAMVAILIDQNVLRDEAVFVDFFGKPAATTPSLAKFHLRTQAPILPVFSYPTAAHTFH
ncbi:MAG: lysophospholipid acyltransferase family protein, partial [Candidatus Aminicenantes bacterium]